MHDYKTRISTIYKIVDKSGTMVRFQPNAAQQEQIANCTDRDIILKARQLGFTTLACILGLDDAITKPNFRAGIIAHTLDDAKVIFDTKIKFAYDNLPAELRDEVTAVNDRAGALKFSNGSSISVSTSFRSGTLQRLHVSEFGKICANSPDKAKEIITGAFPAAENGIITVESTAEGQDGAFFDMTQAAMARQHHGPRDFKFHFYPWHQNPDNVLVDPVMTIPPTTQAYFDKLATMEGVQTTHEQRCWYQVEMSVLGGDMKREHPSVAREAFQQAIEGAYFEGQMEHATKTGGIGRFPFDPRYEVNTFWDLGRNDKTCIWLHQRIADRNRFIGYYENSGEDIAHYIHWLRSWQKEWKAHFDRHYMPHDGDRQSLWLPDGTAAVMDELGFHPEFVPRVQNKLTAINAARGLFASCDFDEQGCEVGLKRLRMYRKEFDEKRGVWRDRPRHDDASHGADSFLTFAMGYSAPVYDDDEPYEEQRGNSSTTGY